MVFVSSDSSSSSRSCKFDVKFIQSFYTRFVFLVLLYIVNNDHRTCSNERDLFFHKRYLPKTICGRTIDNYVELIFLLIVTSFHRLIFVSLSIWKKEWCTRDLSSNGCQVRVEVNWEVNVMSSYFFSKIFFWKRKTKQNKT